MTDSDLERKVAPGAPHCKDCKHGKLLAGGIYFCKRVTAYAAAERANIPGRCGPEGVFWEKIGT